MKCKEYQVMTACLFCNRSIGKGEQKKISVLKGNSDERESR